MSVSVCEQQGKNCTLCNPVNSTPRGELVAIECPTKPRGKVVEINHPEKLKYCDIQVFGELGYESVDSGNGNCEFSKVKKFL